MRPIHTGIVIPCFNEADFFLWEDYFNFLSTEDLALLCFVNDGSTDTTLEVLQRLKKDFPNKVIVLDLEKNVGKAEAVRTGIKYLNTNYSCTILGFIDADLAVSLEEAKEIASRVNEQTRFSFASRILRVGSQIERKTHRFLIGRFLATLISNVLELKVYDTQCGCKFFDPKLTSILFNDPFSSKWLFDVELFFRLKNHFGKSNFASILIEVPLKKWIDRGDSKVSFLYGFKVFSDLYQIKSRYSKK